MSANSYSRSIVVALVLLFFCAATAIAIFVLMIRLLWTTSDRYNFASDFETNGKTLDALIRTNRTPPRHIKDRKALDILTILLSEAQLYSRYDLVYGQTCEMKLIFARGGILSCNFYFTSDKKALLIKYPDGDTFSRIYLCDMTLLPAESQAVVTDLIEK